MDGRGGERLDITESVTAEQSNETIGDPFETRDRVNRSGDEKVIVSESQNEINEGPEDEDTMESGAGEATADSSILEPVMMPLDLSPEGRPPIQQVERIFAQDHDTPRTPDEIRMLIAECDMHLKEQEEAARTDKRTRSEAELSFSDDKNDKRAKVQDAAQFNKRVADNEEVGEKGGVNTEANVELTDANRTENTELRDNRDETANDSEWETDYRTEMGEQVEDMNVVDGLFEELRVELNRIGALKAYKCKFAKAQQMTLANGVDRINGLAREIKARWKEAKPAKKVQQAEKEQFDEKSVKQEMQEMRAEMRLLISDNRAQTEKLLKRIDTLESEVVKLGKDKSDRTEEKRNDDKGQRDRRTERAGQTNAEQTETDEGAQADGEAENEDHRWKRAKRRASSKATYAKIAGGTRSNFPGPEWKTPPPKEKHEVSFLVKDARNAGEAMQSIKAAMGSELKDMGPIKSWFPTKEGRVVLTCSDEAQKNKIATAAKAATGIEVRERNIQNPRLVITGVYKEHKEEDLINMILMENDDIEAQFGDDFRCNFREVGVRKCRNDNKVNITFEARLDIFKYLIRKERIYLDMAHVIIEEALTVVQCYRCNKYGHIAKFCQGVATCQFCGGSHDGRDCEATVMDCINCRTVRVPQEERRHSARDHMCPIFVRKENMARRNINYSQ